MMRGDPNPTETTRVSIVDRVPSWAFLALLGGIIAAFWILSLLSPSIVWEGFVNKYLWTPIVEDEGYNVPNTIALMVILACLLGWAYRLLDELKERMDLELTIAVVPYLVWGSVFRVLEDSDLFGPFNEEIVRVAGSAKAGASCVPDVGGTFFHNCFGVFFITPIIYVEVTFIAVAFLVLGHQAKRVGDRLGLGQGLQYYLLTLLLMFSLYLALWSSDQTFIRFMANPVVVLAACAVAFFLVWRQATSQGSINPRWAMFGHSLVFLVVGLYYVVLWMGGGRGTWAPTDEVSWWIFFALLIAPTLVAISVALKGRAFSGRSADGISYGQRVENPRRPILILMLLVVVEAVALFIAMLGFHTIEEQIDGGTLLENAGITLGALAQLLVGPAAVVAGVWLARRLARGASGVHPALVFYAAPVNLLMVWGQSSDGLMTSLGIDVFHYDEKHVLPAFLIDFVRGLGLPAPFGSYPTALVMIPLKILLVLVVVWLIDLSAQEDARGRQNLIGLVKLAIIMVGLSPGVRDAVRLAMAT